MKKLLLSLSAILFFAFTIEYPCEEMVWICAKNMSYHKISTCPQIKNCNPTQVTLSEAKTKGKNVCSICYPKQKQAVKKSTEKKQTTNATSSQATKTQKTTTTKTQATKTKKK
ncbi:MAG: hypothetical protein MJ197_09505 [Bacteroidales bacterium]|nr:hypothetical protein [Bacteroidales bacterium]